MGTLLFGRTVANFRRAYTAAANYTVTQVSAQSCVQRGDCFSRFGVPSVSADEVLPACIAPHHRETGTSLLTSVLDPYKAHAAVRYWSLPSNAYATVDKLAPRPRPMRHFDAAEYSGVSHAQTN